MNRNSLILPVPLVAILFISSCDKRPLEEKALDQKNLSSPEATRTLLKEGMDPNKGPLLYAAVEDRQKKTVQTLLDGGALPDVHRSGTLKKTPLFIAAYNGDKEICEMLLAKGADPNAVDLFDNNPLREAIGGRRKHIVALLLSKGSNPEQRNRDGETMRQFAEEHGTPEIRVLFQKHSAP